MIFRRTIFPKVSPIKSNDVMRSAVRRTMLSLRRHFTPKAMELIFENEWWQMLFIATKIQSMSCKLFVFLKISIWVQDNHPIVTCLQMLLSLWSLLLKKKVSYLKGRSDWTHSVTGDNIDRIYTSLVPLGACTR